MNWARSAFEWLGEKPKYQWTLTSNPLLGERSSKWALPLNRGARLTERLLMVGWAVGAYVGAPVICGMLGLTVGAPLTLPVLAIAAFNLKANATMMGVFAQGGVMMGRFLSGAFDQIINGPDEFRPVKFKTDKNGRQQAPQPKGPSPIDRMIALGQTFNGSSRPGGQPLGGTVIWGDAAPGTAPTPSTTYDGTVKVPTTEQLTVANGRREGVERMINHPNDHPQRHEPPPPPVFKPPNCD